MSSRSPSRPVSPHRETAGMGWTRESRNTQLVGLRFRATLGQEVEVMLF